MDNIEEFKNIAVELGYDPKEVEAFSQVVAESNPSVGDSGTEFVPSFSETAKNMGYAPTEVDSFAKVADTMGAQTNQVADMGDFKFTGSALGAPATLTQQFGNRNHRYDAISGGVNRGADFAIPEGTPLFAPEGSWVVVDAYNGAKGRGMQNSGWGNSALLQNKQTGEQIRMSHLSRLGVKAGDEITGGSPIGLSGSTGHATGPHVDVEYINSNGKLSDVLRSPYAQQFMK